MDTNNNQKVDELNLKAINYLECLGNRAPSEQEVAIMELLLLMRHEEDVNCQPRR